MLRILPALLFLTVSAPALAQPQRRSPAPTPTTGDPAQQASKPPVANAFPAEWQIVSEVRGDAPLFANERTQLVHAVHEWASAHGARLMPADTIARLPPNRCAVSTTRTADVKEIYPQVGSIMIVASCNADACSLRISSRDARGDQTGEWQSELPRDTAHEVSTWLAAVPKLQPEPKGGGGLLVGLSLEAQRPPLSIEDVDAFGVDAPVYDEDFTVLQANLQSCHFPVGSGSGSHSESILIAATPDGRVAGCEAKANRTLDPTTKRNDCLCNAAKRTPLPAALATRGRARVRIELMNRPIGNGPTLKLLNERRSPNMLKGINASFGQITGSMESCFARHPHAAGDTRQLKIGVQGTGHLQSANLTGGAPNPALNQCLTEALRAARFPCTKDGQPGTFEATLEVQPAAASAPKNPR